ncbi:MAG TPA: SMP-30/gluconolactonase/LRE family protein [Rhodothermales bacterium]|nr:SMP-30/gluconolactonase/LRE family protein [Rhodothermales bacterium]
MRQWYVLGLLLLGWSVLSVGRAQTVETITDAFNASGGVVRGPDGNIYVADFGLRLDNQNGTTVYRVTPEGQRSVFATGFVGASGNAFDAQGNLYQSNIADRRISKVTPDGIVSTFATTGILAPVGIAVDSQDNVFVANCGDHTIRKITPDGTSTAFASSALFACPNGLTIDENDNLYTSNFNNGNVLRIEPDGTVSLLATIPGGNNGHLTYSHGQLYVVARCANQIYRLSLTGQWTLVAGSGARGNADGPATQATFSIPNGIAASVTGDTLYVNDAVPTTGGCVSGSLNPIVLRRIILDTDTGVADRDEVPETITLLQNYPNPFNPATRVHFRLPRTAFVRLRVFDLLGREVTTLVEGMRSAGQHEAVFEAEGLPGGVYVYRLEAAGIVRARAMLLLK